MIYILTNEYTFDNFLDKLFVDNDELMKIIYHDTLYSAERLQNSLLEYITITELIVNLTSVKRLVLTNVQMRREKK